MVGAFIAFIAAEVIMGGVFIPAVVTFLIGAFIAFMGGVFIAAEVIFVVTLVCNSDKVQNQNHAAARHHENSEEQTRD